MVQFNFGELSSIFEMNFHKYNIGLKAYLTAEGSSKRRYQYCSDISITNLFLRALQGHSGRNLIDPFLQDNVIIQCGLFRYIYHMGCAFNLHSIINNGLIPRNQDSSKRQIICFLSIDPIDKDHKDLKHNDFSVKRRARYLHSAWRKHQNAIFWVDIDIAIKRGLTHFQTRLDAIIFQKKTSLFNSKSCEIKNWRYLV